jgi:hypothetical protein
MILELPVSQDLERSEPLTPKKNWRTNHGTTIPIEFIERFNQSLRMLGYSTSEKKSYRRHFSYRIDWNCDCELPDGKIVPGRGEHTAESGDLNLSSERGLGLPKGIGGYSGQV